MDSLARSFVMETCLGKGGFGEVYLARMTTGGGIERKVAIKLLHAGLDAQGQAVERLRDEGRMLATLDHPSVLKVVDVTTLQHRVALITEFVDGQDLGDCVRAGLPKRALVEAIGQVAMGLAAAFDQLAIVHRDVKPSNIRIGRHGDVKLLDFGIARTEQMTREARTATDMVLGSLPYMSPERFFAPDAQPAGDVFALGATLYEGIAGKRFYGGRAPVSFLVGLSGNPDKYADHLDKRIAALPDGLPDDLLTLLRDTLAHDPEARPSGRELADRCDAVAALLEGKGLGAWCRSREWPAPPSEEGPWSGRTITEGFTIEERVGGTPQVVQEAPLTAPVTAGPGGSTEARTQRVWVAAGGGLALLGLLGGAGIVAVGVAAVLYLGMPVGETAAGEDPVQAELVGVDAADRPVDDAAVEEGSDEEGSDEVGSEEVGSEEAEPGADAGTEGPEPGTAEGREGGAPSEAAASSQAPVAAPAAAPGVAPTPSPEPKRVAPLPAPAAPKPAPAPAQGAVLASGARVELRAGGETRPPGLVPVGTWEVWADFGGGFVQTGTVAVDTGEVRLVCNGLLQTCEVQ